MNAINIYCVPDKTMVLAPKELPGWWGGRHMNMYLGCSVVEAAAEVDPRASGNPGGLSKPTSLRKERLPAGRAPERS